MPFSRVPKNDTTSHKSPLYSRERDRQINNIKDTDQFFVPEEFRRKVIGHLLKNRIPKLYGSLILGIQGPPGEGKSFQLQTTLASEGVEVITLSGATLSGQHEGDAIEPIQTAYINASDLFLRTKREVCIVIDDFDLSVASTFDTAEYTVNSQLLAGFLMNLADNPKICAGKACERIPIIITGNDFTRLYAPLTRHGRFDVYDWKPNIDMRIKIVDSILSPMVERQNSNEIASLVRQHHNQPISFFASLRGDIIDSILEDVGENSQEFKYYTMLKRLNMHNFKLNYEIISLLAKKRASTGSKDFLTGKRSWLR